MKIGLYGPGLLQLAIGLRDIGINGVHFLIDKDNPSLSAGISSEPALNDPSFAEVDSWETKRSFLFPDSSLLAKRLREFDVLLLSDVGVMFGPGSSRPYIFFPAGYDLTALPFPWRAKELRNRGLPDIKAGVVSFQQKRGIVNATGVWTYGFRPFREALQRLGLPAPKPGDYLPVAFDHELFSYSEPVDRDDESAKELYVLHPSRLLMRRTEFLEDIGRNKRNELLFEGIAKTIESGNRVKLVMIERDSSSDIELAKQWLDQLGIADCVTWISRDMREGLNHLRMVELYRECDVVADDFGAGWFGGVALEGASVGRPVVNKIEPETMSSLYPEHPFLHASTADEIRSRLEALVDPVYRRSVGELSSMWAVKHHGRENVAHRCLRMLERLSI